MESILDSYYGSGVVSTKGFKNNRGKYTFKSYRLSVSTNHDETRKRREQNPNWQHQRKVGKP